MAKRKPGKYDHLYHKLQPLPPTDLLYQERVEVVKTRITQDHSVTGVVPGAKLVELYVNARHDKEALEQAQKDAGLELAALEQLLVASQEEGDDAWGAFGGSDRTVRMATGDALRVQPEIYALRRERDTFREWCYANGQRNKMELPDKVTTDLVKDRLLNGQPEPPGIEVYVRTKIVYTPLKTEEVENQPSTNDLF